MEVGKVSEKQSKPQVIEPVNTGDATTTPQTVSIFNIDEKSQVGQKVQEKADKNLISITDYITKKDNKNISLTKTAGIFGMGAALLGLFAKSIFFKGPKPSTGLTIGVIGLAFVTVAGLVELLGGKEKRKAGYTKFAAQTKDKAAIDFSLAPKTESDFIEKTGKVLLSSSATEPLDKKEIANNAEDAIGKDNIHTRGIYFVNSKSDNQKAENLLVVDATINSDEYNGLSEDGIQKTYYEIPVEYSEFIKNYLNSKTMTKEQTDRFIEIIKALQTDGIYSKEQSVQKHVARKEDVEIFDLSGDEKINYGDIVAAQLIAKIKNNAFSSKDLAAFDDVKNWDADKLFNILAGEKYTQANIIDDLFDLNGDGNVDEKDFTLYQNIKKGDVKKFDINNDGKIDIRDAKLVKQYTKGFIDRYNNKGEFLKNFVDIMGGEDCIKILEEYFQDEELKEQLKKAS